jgi:hypothetical protein
LPFRRPLIKLAPALTVFFARQADGALQPSRMSKIDQSMSIVAETEQIADRRDPLDIKSANF